MPAPVIVRNFAAVEVATGYHTYYLNRQRLLDAIELLRLLLAEGTPREEMCEIGHMMDLYPSLTVHQAINYVNAAIECINHKVNP